MQDMKEVHHLAEKNKGSRPERGCYTEVVEDSLHMNRSADKNWSADMNWPADSTRRLRLADFSYHSCQSQMFLDRCSQRTCEISASGSTRCSNKMRIIR